MNWTSKIKTMNHFGYLFLNVFMFLKYLKPMKVYFVELIFFLWFYVVQKIKIGHISLDLRS